MGYFQYLMEHPEEGERLAIKDKSEYTRRQLLDTGLDQLGPDTEVVDAGSGVGVVAAIMGEILPPSSRITLLDGSFNRMQQAKQHTRNDSRLINCLLHKIPLKSDSIDYLFSRFVFEYLTNPIEVFNELVRIVKPGGKLVIGDLDNNGLNHHALNQTLQYQLNELVSEIQNKQLLDFFAGRKLYSYFNSAKFRNIKVHLYAHHLFYGQLSHSDEVNWESKFNHLIGLQRSGSISLSFDLTHFKDQMMTFLKSPDRFSYTPLILVEGHKP